MASPLNQVLEDRFGSKISAEPQTNFINELFKRLSRGNDAYNQMQENDAYGHLALYGDKQAAADPRADASIMMAGRPQAGLPNLGRALMNNASGESSASMEAMSRMRSMAGKGEQFGVYDRAGNFRKLIGTDAVDYVPQAGETFVVQGPSGARVLTANGGKVPSAAPMGQMQPMAAAKPAPQPSTYAVNDIGQGSADALLEALGIKRFLP